MIGKIIVFGFIGMLGMADVTPAWADGEAIISTGIGAALGGLFGSQFGHSGGQAAAVGAGVLAGGLIGNDIGQSLERSDARYGGNSAVYAYAPYQPTFYDVAPNYVAPPAPPPALTYGDEGLGSYCREFSQEIHIAGRVQESYGTACLQPDGSWRVVQ